MIIYYIIQIRYWCYPLIQVRQRQNNFGYTLLAGFGQQRASIVCNIDIANQSYALSTTYSKKPKPFPTWSFHPFTVSTQLRPVQPSLPILQLISQLEFREKLQNIVSEWRTSRRCPETALYNRLHRVPPRSGWSPQPLRGRGNGIFSQPNFK